MTTVARETTTRIPVRTWLAVGAVALGIFLVVTAEQLPIGLLVPVGSELGVSEGVTGLMVTIPGIVAAIAAPVVPVLAGRLNRRILLGILMAVMTGANAISALSPSFGVMLGSRVLVGIAIGGFWAIAGGLATRLVPEHAVPRATAIIFGGVAAANVFGVPLGTLLGDYAGWRIAFTALGGVALLLVIALVSFLPSLSATVPVRPSALLAQLRNKGVLIGILATFLIVTGHLGAYTYISPVLRDVSGIDPGLVGVLLFGFGLAGMAGNFVVGAALARTLRRTVFVMVLGLAASMLLFPVLGTSPVTGIVLLVLWGLSYGGVSVALQTWMIKAAPDAVEAASSLWVSMFNLSIGLGALVGGTVVDSIGLPSVPLLGGVLVLISVLTVVAVRKNPKLA